MDLPFELSLFGLFIYTTTVRRLISSVNPATALDQKSDPGCCAVVDGPGDENGLPNYAVVNLETARELLDDGESGVTCLIVTD